jgi:hypothetical protein
VLIRKTHNKFRISLVCWIFPAHQSNFPCCTQNSCSQPHVTHTDFGAVEFGTFLLAINFNIEKTVMVTSLPLGLHHALTSLILNLGTVGTVVLSSRSSHITPGNSPDTYWLGYCVCVCQKTGLHVSGWRISAYPVWHSTLGSSIIQPTDWSLWACGLS